MIYFYTESEIPLEALRLMGASTKGDDDTKIGFFGTGFKYAIATLLRENISFGVRINGVDVSINTRITTMRDMEFEEIYIDNMPTSYTTRVGVDWEVWHAVREIWQNTVDENGSIVRNAITVPEYDGSFFWIDEESNEEMQNVVREWDNYFRSTDWDGVEPHSHGDLDFLQIFYRGMRVSGNNQRSLFAYGTQRTQSLNEMRLMRDYNQEYLVEHLMQEYLIMSEWEYLLNHPERNDSYEWGRFTNMSFYLPNESLRDALSSYRIYPEGWKDVIYQYPRPLEVPFNCMVRLMAKFPELDYAVQAGGYTEVECAKCAQKLLKVVMQIHTLTGLELPAKLGIGDFLQSTTLGIQQNSEERIVIAHRLLKQDSDLSDLDLWATVLEEMVHANTGHEDNSRALETYLFELIAENLIRGRKMV